MFIEGLRQFFWRSGVSVFPTHPFWNDPIGACSALPRTPIRCDCPANLSMDFLELRITKFYFEPDLYIGNIRIQLNEIFYRKRHRFQMQGLCENSKLIAKLLKRVFFIRIQILISIDNFFDFFDTEFTKLNKPRIMPFLY